MVADLNTTRRPHPAVFDDYQSYLQAMVAHLKATQRQFSYRYFSRKAGFASPNFLKLVAEGKRNLTGACMGKFARGLGLSEEESEAFQTLVLLSQAQTDDERNRLYLRLRGTKGVPKHLVHRLESDQFDIYSSWHVLPIRELMLHEDFREDAVWIGKQLTPRVPAAEVRRALNLLERVGLVERDDDGRLRPRDVQITTGAKTRSLAVRNYHRAMLSLGSEALDREPIERRNVSSLTVNITPDKYEQIIERVFELRRDILEIVDTDDGSVDESQDVYQLEISLFPLTRKDNS